MTVTEQAVSDGSEWQVFTLCYCPECRQRRWNALVSKLYPEGLSITVRLWRPGLPFEWPTTQKAICA